MGLEGQEIGELVCDTVIAHARAGTPPLFVGAVFGQFEDFEAWVTPDGDLECSAVVAFVQGPDYPDIALLIMRNRRRFVQPSSSPMDAAVDVVGCSTTAAPAPHTLQSMRIR
eukprot:CAMPEP_0167796760 /NCGR_PEP_ID=MMETSP0111_2-20121227/15242_1 /TAXON_ID=91324 /ORGANISM="Lotharella globosa, Strain CCCM811" /LENGTH=111 /DNA_ID=CAMNT_0007690719 /DNA_START=987 /DNA_END=1319 /DNA_ORIENTATION=+